MLLKLFLALLTGASVAAPAGASEGVVERSFTVIRNGEEIGTREARIVHNGNSVDVSNVTRIQVKVLFITVYRRQENLSELWIDDQLHRFSSQVDNNGNSYSINVVRTENGKLHVDRPAGAYEAPKNALPATFWHERVVRTNALIHVMRGRLQQVKSTFVGTEPIKMGESTIDARRYRMTGDERVDLWFDGKGLAVKVTYYTRNGGTIDFLAKDNIGAAGPYPPKP